MKSCILNLYLSLYTNTPTPLTDVLFNLNVRLVALSEHSHSQDVGVTNKEKNF